MAFDGIVTRAMAWELKQNLIQGKIEKVYQPETDILVFNIHTRAGNRKLLMSSGSAHARIHLIESSPVNPPEPYAFCMLMRKALQGARILDIYQKDCERIIEIVFESLNELGFTVNKKLIVEIMGKHSNIILIDLQSGKIIDSIKRVSFDVNRVRQILPGLIYQYPPEQDKTPFDSIGTQLADRLNESVVSAKQIMTLVGGVSPAFCEEASTKDAPGTYIKQVSDNVSNGKFTPVIYYDFHDNPMEFHVISLGDYEDVCTKKSFDGLSQCLEEYYSKKAVSNQSKQKAHDIIKSVSDTLSKKYLKKKKLSEDLLKAENSEDLRLFGELLTANLHMIKPGDRFVDVISYYDGTTVRIPLDVKLSPAKNAQQYYKKYGKAKTAIHEKQIQLDENEQEITYLESVLSFLDKTDDVPAVEAIRSELIETGYLKRKKIGGFKEKKARPEPLKYMLQNGMECLVGRNNRENDYLTFKLAQRGDIWLHTKDIPGSHVVVKTGGIEPNEEFIYEAAALAAYHSKAGDSENVPVDYVPVKFVKKPAGAKPGMVIFTNNRTVYINPKEGKRI